MQASVQPVHVLMITDGSYPYSAGGVSTWCDMLILIYPTCIFRWSASSAILPRRPDICAAVTCAACSPWPYGECVRPWRSTPD